jgi:serine/threonine-protein kinase
VVLAQNPAAGAAADTVSLLVNRGERGATYVMPDLIGVNAQRAAEVLRGRGFRVALVAEQPYPGVPPGIVLRQSPLGGFQIAPGDAISLEVSR